MRIPLVDALAGNDAALANVERALAERLREDALVAALVAALDARDATRSSAETSALHAAA